MLDIEAAVIARLKANSDVIAITGGRVDAMIATPPRPNVVLYRITTARAYHNGGSTRMPSALIQIDCNADTYKASKSLAEAVRTSLDGFRGAIGDRYICGMFIQDERDEADTPPDGSVKPIPRVILQLTVTYQETQI